MYNNIRYCWNVFYYILWHYEIKFYKCMFWFVQHFFLWFLPAFLRNKAEENYHKGLLLYKDEMGGFGINFANGKLDTLAILHMSYLVGPITGVYFRLGYTSSLIPVGLAMLLAVVMLHYGDKLIYEEKKRKRFFASCTARRNRWFIKWYIITFTYYGFTIFASTFGSLQIMVFIKNLRF